MSGIAGWIDWQEDLSGQATIIETMIGRLSHHGPDAYANWLSKSAALAHRHQGVIDPVGGEQPMIYRAEEQTYVLTYDGELYNFQELRSDLSTRGHSFQTDSDAEVLLHAYIEWGQECTKHLNGVFAFGLWDTRKQQLFLARDHMGLKPLFYAQRGSALLFASEIKALLAHPLVEAEVDSDGLAQIFAGVSLHVPGFVVYCNMHEVRPGEQIVFTRERKQVSRYWSLRSVPHTDDLPTTIERIRALLSDSVRRQLTADVPVVTLLSGGLNSSGLTALAAREFQHEHRSLHTYSIDFVENEKYFAPHSMQNSLDEPWVRLVSEYVGTQHHTIMVDSPELIENLLVPMRTHDMPRILGQLETSLYLFFNAVKQDATVALTGETADAIFGGNTWFFDKEVQNADIFPWVKYVLGKQTLPFSWWSSDVKEKFRPQKYLERRYQEAREEVPLLSGEDAFHAKIREIAYMGLSYRVPTLLDRMDRMSRIIDLKVRMPYCDHRLVEYVWNIPWEMKMVGDMKKGLLRRALADLLPPEVCNRKKNEFPSSLHPQYEQKLSEWALQILHDPNAPIRPFLNMPVAHRLVEGNLPGLTGVIKFAPMEQIIQINAWLEEYHICIR